MTKHLPYISLLACVTGSQSLPGCSLSLSHFLSRSRALVCARALALALEQKPCLIGYIGGLVVAVILETVGHGTSAATYASAASKGCERALAERALTRSLVWGCYKFWHPRKVSFPSRVWHYAAGLVSGGTHGKCLVRMSQLLMEEMKRPSQCQPFFAHTASQDSPCAPATVSTSAGIFPAATGKGDKQCFFSLM